MSKVQFNVPAKAQVDLSDVAEIFAGMNSQEQAVILEELFDALKFKCKDHFHFESQLLYISKDIKGMNFKNLNYVFETLNSFIQDKEGV